MGIKDKIVLNLNIVRNAEDLEGNVFKVRAYDRVIEQIKALPSRKRIKTVQDLEKLGVTGMGDSISTKVAEILKTGTLEAAKEAKEKVDCFLAISKVHGIGNVKARDLMKRGICTIEELRAHTDLLNDVQKMGLDHYEHFQKRIPRAEMERHEKALKVAFKDFECTISGSYRRGAKSSGDIDLLITTHTSTPAPTPTEATKMFKEAVAQLKQKGYITGILAFGDKKCMAIAKLPRSRTFRRLDIMLTPPEEYPYAILYFTGSQAFNIGFRGAALAKGYTINEHRMVPTKGKGKGKAATQSPPSVPSFKTEKDIFDFLGLRYVKPEDRNENIFAS